MTVILIFYQGYVARLAPLEYQETTLVLLSLTAHPEVRSKTLSLPQAKARLSSAVQDSFALATGEIGAAILLLPRISSSLMKPFARPAGPLPLALATSYV
jgi:hypothetical protein